MRFFDLHCDTLYRALAENKTLFETEFQLSLNRGKDFTSWLQCMAVWIPDELSPEEGFALFNRAHFKLMSELDASDIPLVSCAADILNAANPSVILTVENASLIGESIEKIYELKKADVKVLTLTWNGRNSIGDGAGVLSPGGITEFGKKAVRALESCKIVIDVSHAGVPLFYDVAELARRPFIATHSNSRACTEHNRNLTDEQFKLIKQSGGIVGINFCDMFLNNKPENAGINDIIRHTEHFLSLGGEKTLSFGSDFDGCDVPADISSIDGISSLYNAFLRLNYSEALLDRLFFENARDFFVDYFDI